MIVAAILTSTALALSPFILLGLFEITRTPSGRRIRRRRRRIIVQ